MPCRFAWCALLSVSVLLGSGAPARAQSGDGPASREATERARVYFQEGLELADEGDWERAVHRFRQALELREAAPVRYNLALSLAEMGRLTEAIEELDRVLALADAEQEVRAQSIERRRELSTRLGHLTVEVRGDPEGTQVTVDGRPWLSIGEASLADPGIRVVRLLRDAEELDVAEADVPEGGEERVLLEVPSPGEETDDAWVWGVVVGVVLAVAGAAVVTGVVLADQTTAPSMGDFMPPILEVD